MKVWLMITHYSPFFQICSFKYQPDWWQKNKDTALPEIIPEDESSSTMLRSLQRRVEQNIFSFNEEPHFFLQVLYWLPTRTRRLTAKSWLLVMATDVTEEYNTSGKGGEKGTLKKYLVLLLQLFKYQLGSERSLLGFLAAGGKQSHGMMAALLGGTIWWD